MGFGVDRGFDLGFLAVILVCLFCSFLVHYLLVVVYDNYPGRRWLPRVSGI